MKRSRDAIGMVLQAREHMRDALCAACGVELFWRAVQTHLTDSYTRPVRKILCQSGTPTGF